ncbi:hypothetical protein TSUD_320240 [Trifolium subterraneum]|uniref:DNA-directed DNA polymerase n=1 Tax=Trifolium subterraneum TaxID=3900 RepID=A0A2Z6NPV0_TRISU|nr:hypothetical protein TSUD_320240 [Trifolium subterraneum]
MVRTDENAKKQRMRAWGRRACLLDARGELADSIVQCGQCTLEKAISFVNLHEKWNAEVIYGDTDRSNLLSRVALVFFMLMKAPIKLNLFLMPKVKIYLQCQWKRILSGRVSVKDFIFAKEVRLGTYSARISSLPSAAIVATKAMRVNRRAEPRYAERIPYVVIHGEPGARLVDMVVDPLEVLAIDSPFRINDL